MALLKSIEQEDGVITEYHRIQFLQLTTNHHNSIAVLSYINESTRLNEINGGHPYKTATTYETDYDETMTIESAYEYLKSLPEFKQSEDI